MRMTRKTLAAANAQLQVQLAAANREKAQFEIMRDTVHNYRVKVEALEAEAKISAEREEFLTAMVEESKVVPSA